MDSFPHTNNNNSSSSELKKSSDKAHLKVSFNEETIWLRQDEISLLFDVDRTSVTKHINKIYHNK